MRLFRNIGAITGLAWLVAACAGEDVILEKPLSGYVQNPQEIVQATDWSKVQEIRLVYTTQGSRTELRPSLITLQAGMPYRFVLDNQSLDPQALAGREFFKAVAVRKVVAEDGSTLDMPTIISVGINRGETRTLEFVPVKKGRYEISNGDVLSAVAGLAVVVVE